MEKRYRQQKYKQWLRRLSIEQHYNRVIEMCTNYLEQKLTTSNCIDMLIFAHNHGMDRLYRVTASFIDVHFESVFTSDEFLELSIDKMITLMPLLVYDEMSESDMENALVLWSKYKRIERKKRMDLMRPNYKDWESKRNDQQQQQTIAMAIKSEPNDELSDDVPDAPPPPRISD